MPSSRMSWSTPNTVTAVLASRWSTPPETELASLVCEHLHVGFDAELTAFYIDACGFRPTGGGLMAL